MSAEAGLNPVARQRETFEAIRPVDPAESLPQRYWLPPHVYACPTAGGVVALDLVRNRYFGLGPRETRAFFMLVSDWAHSNAHQADIVEPIAPDVAERIANDLVTAGLLSHDEPTGRVITPVVIDRSGTLTSVGHELDGSISIHPGHVLNFLRAYTWAKRAARSRSLYSVACEVSRCKASELQALPAFDVQQAVALVGIFRRLRPYTFAARDQCLLHALALVRFLSHYRLSPAWVIGVRTRPWGAHSWVQHESFILDSIPEHVLDYTPIMVV